MQIEFVNHACYVVRSGGISLMADPWLEGPAFHNGWDLIAPSAWTYDRFNEISHIWFSHEHPDHFSPMVLKKIAPELRKQITVIYQETGDKKVVEFCRKLGFGKVQELPRRWVQLTDQVRLLNIPHTDGDSWLCLEAEGLSVLNINDCNLESNAELDYIRRKCGKRPDILFTQFSYANAIGNRDDITERAAAAKSKLREVKRQIRVLKPKYVVPFASFVWFSHKENFFRNDAVNSVDKAADTIKDSGAEPVVLFNGDIWNLGEYHNNNSSIEKWAEAYRTSINVERTHKALSISPADLREVALKFLSGMVASNHNLIRYFLKGTHIYVTDHGQAYYMDLDTWKPASKAKHQCDVSIGSEALAYSFTHLWGGSTTRINGRYEVPSHGIFANFKGYFLISQLNNHGRIFNMRYALAVGAGMLRKRLSRK